MISFLCVHIHLRNMLYIYGRNHELDNKVICIYMTGGVNTAHVEIFLMKFI